MDRKDESLLFLLLGIAPGLIVTIGALLIVPQFQDVFVNFGATLPLQTRILLATFHWWGIIVLGTLGFWMFWPNPSHRGTAAMTFGLASAMLLFLFGTWAAYAPIFELAKTVG